MSRYFLFSEVQPQSGFIGDMFCFAEHVSGEEAYDEAGKFIAESFIQSRVHIGFGEDENSARLNLVDAVWSEWPYDQDEIDMAISKWLDESPGSGLSIVRYFKSIRTYGKTIAPFEVQVSQNGYYSNISVERYL